MGARKQDRIPKPRVGMVVVENDPRGALPKKIVGTDPWHIYTQSGRDGSGRRSRIKRKRLEEGRYHLLFDPERAEGGSK